MPERVNAMDNNPNTPKRNTPSIESKLRHNIVRLPVEIRKASGIVIWGRRIKSLVFTTDIAIIRNCDADAVLAVYPFTPQQAISSCIIQSAYIPVFCGVGGSLTKGIRSISMLISLRVRAPSTLAIQSAAETDSQTPSSASSL